MTPSENRFHRWLDRLDITHIFQDQSLETFAKAFRGKSKRPDFLILPNGKKPYFVDVKEKRLEVREGIDDAPCFEISTSDFEKSLQLQARYNIRVWFAFTPDSNKDTWYFIDVYWTSRLDEKYKNNDYTYIPFRDKFNSGVRRYDENTKNTKDSFFLNYLTKNSPCFSE